MDSTTLRLFVEVMQAQSFATVARHHNLDPSSVSRAIAKLEAELEFKLFHRSTRKLSPTEAGTIYFERIAPLIDELESARQMALDISQQPQGKVRVTASPVFAEQQIVPLLPEFAQQYPAISLELILTDAYLDLIAERIDIAVRLGTLQDSSYRVQHVRTMEFFICASPAYLNQYGYPQTPQAIAQHNCLLFPRTGYRLDWLLQDAAGKITQVAIHGNYLLTNSMAIKQCAIAGMGLALLPDWLIQSDIQSGRLVRLFAQYQVSTTNDSSSIWLLYPSREYLPLKTRVFMGYLAKQLKQLTGSG